MNTKQFPIFYFSGTGNTWWVGQQLEAALNSRGFQSQAISIEQISPENVTTRIDQAEIIGLGYPIYGSDAPEIMKTFIENLPVVKTPKKMMIYITQMAWSGNGAYFMRRQIEKKGYQIDWAIHFNMPSNIPVDLPSISTSSDYDKFIPLLEKRRQQAEKLADRIVTNKTWIHGNNPVSFLASWLQRGPWQFIYKWAQNHTLSVDPDKCSHCGRCERICPSENIHLIDGLPVFGDQCNLCMRCYSFCPEQAILVYKRPFNTKRFGDKPFQGPVPEFKPELIDHKVETKEMSIK